VPAANVAETTAFNRSVYASPPYGGSGYEKPQSAYGLCAVFLRHIFASPGNLRFPLSGLQKRHRQPERYTPFALKSVWNILYKKIYKMKNNKMVDKTLINRLEWI
jgi:hypothetical protein